MRIGRQMIPVKETLLAVALSLCGCHITLISDYDDTFDQEATTAQKDVDALLQKIINNPQPRQPNFTAETYSADKDAYAKIDNELDALLVRAQAHQSNTGTIDSVNRIMHSFSLIEAEHKTKTAIHIEAVRNELTLMNHEFTALIAQELLKKQGSSNKS
jgi:hypothetical protein